MIVNFFEHVYLVASGRLGFSMTSDYDCNVYLLSSEDDAIVIDAGCGLEVEQIVRNIEEAGVPPVSRVLLTHAHADHAAGAHELAQALGAEVWASNEAAEMLESGDSRRSGLDTAKSAGVYPASVHFVPTRIAQRVDGGRDQVGSIPLEILPTPGHAAGHLSFLARLPNARVLFSGDAVFARGRVVVLPTPDCSIPALAASVDRLAEARPDSFFPGHCEPVLRCATEHVKMACTSFHRGAIPPSLT